MAAGRTMRQRLPRRWPPESVLIEYESVFRPPPASVDRRTFLKTAAAAALTSACAGGCRTPGHDAVQRHPADDAVAAAPARLPAPHRCARRISSIRRRSCRSTSDGSCSSTTSSIEETSLERVFHRPDYHPANPVLRPTTRWEKYDEYAERTKTRSNPAAMAFSDGVFYDPQDRLFKMWYMGGYSQNTCYALSRDGIEWNRPSLDVVPGTNITMAMHRDSCTVWLDLDERDPSRRYKMASWYDKYLSPLRVGRRHSLARNRSQRCGRRSHDVLLQSVPEGVGLQHSRRRSRCERALSPLLSRRPTSSGAPPGPRTIRWRGSRPTPTTRAVRNTTCRPSSTTSTASRTKACCSGLFTIFRGERDRAREAERHLRRLQPRRIPLGSARSTTVPSRVRTRRRLELGQRPVRGRLLPRGRGSAAFLLSAAAAASRAATTLASAAPAWRHFAATGSRPWVPPHPHPA